MSKKTSLIVVTLITIICILVFKNYLFLKNAYYFYDICSDGIYGGYPVYYNLADNVAKYGLPSWSFKVGMGQNILPYMLRDPFDIIFYIGGKNNVIPLTVYIEVIKIILSGLLFFKYLRTFNFSWATCITGSLLFSFCGFMIEGSAWFTFTFEAFNFAVLLLAFEMLYRQQKWYLFPIGIFLVGISMPFNLYVYGLFLLFYSLFRHLQSGKFNWIALRQLYIKMAGLSILGILLAGPFFLQNLWFLSHSPRGSGTNTLAHQLSSRPVFAPSDHLQLGSAIMRFFSSDILGSGSNYKGWDTIIGAPLFYCGLPCLLLLPQIFIFLSKKLRILYVVSLLLWLLPVVFPYFRYAFWLFAGDYYRIYAFFVAFLILFCALYALENLIQKRQINYIVLVITLGALLGILYFPPFISNNTVDNGIRNFVAAMLVVYTVIFLVVTRVKNKIPIYIFIIAVICEVTYSASITANKRDTFSIAWLGKTNKVLYNSYLLDAANYLNKSDHSFYRIDKNFAPPSARYTDLNFNAVQGYNATSCYSSFNQLYYIKYLQLMGVLNKENETESRWAIGLLDRPILESENNVKYFFSVNNYKPTWPEIWDSIGTKGDVTIYKNKFVLPFGYTYDHYIKENDFEKASASQKEFITMRAVVINDEDIDNLGTMQEFQLSDTSKSELNSETFIGDWKNISHDTLSITNFEDRHLSGTIELEKDKLVYISIPFDEGWHVIVDGKKYKKIIVNGGMTGIFLSKGHHNIQMFYKLNFMGAGLIMSLIAIIILLIGNWGYIKRISSRNKNSQNATSGKQLSDGSEDRISQLEKNVSELQEQYKMIINKLNEKTGKD